MKVEIVIDEAYSETTVKIFAKQYSNDLDELKANLLQRGTDKLVVFDETSVRLLDSNDILRFYTENGKVYLDTLQGTYVTRLKMYELEAKLDAKKFRQISRSEIVNLDYVLRLDLSFSGTIALEMKDKKNSYVARRYLKEFKEALGL